MARASFTPVGLNRDIPPSDLDPNIYTSAENVNFRRGLGQRASRGIVAFGTPIDRPVYLQDALVTQGNFWLYASEGVAQSINATDGTNHVAITPANLAANNWVPETNAFSQGNVNGFPFFQWGAEGAYWPGDFTTPGVMLDMPGLDTAGDPDNSFVPACRSMRAHQNRLIALNTVDDAGVNFEASEQTIVWSSLPSPADSFPDDWIPRVTNSAGSAQLSGGGPVIDGFTLRSSFIIYLQDRTYILDEVGGTFVFLIRSLSRTTGVLTRNCVAKTPQGHVVLSADDVYVNDGTNFKSIVDNVVKVDLFSQMGDNFQNAFVAYYANRAEVWVCIPTGSSIYPNLAYIYDTGTRKWGVRELPDIAYGDTGPLPFPSDADNTWDAQAPGVDWDTFPGRWNQARTSSAAAGLLLAQPDSAAATPDPRFISIDSILTGESAVMFTTSSIERQDLSLDAPNQTKLIRRIWPRIEGTQGDVVTVSCGVRDSLDGAAVIYRDSPFTIGVDEKVDVFCSGKFVSVKLQQTQGSSWLMSGFDIEYELRGQF